MQNPENMINPMTADIQSCPVATQDPGIRASNTDQAVQLANYGAANMEAKCGKCIYFDISKRMKNCIDEEDPAIGYCHRWQFQCQKQNTCDAWDEGGPIKSEKQSLQMQSEYQEDAIRQGPHVPKEEIMSSITPVQEEQLPAEDMSAEEYVTAARRGGQVSSILKKKRLGGIKKAQTGSELPTYKESWDANTDNVQSKYDSYEDYVAAAEQWWADQGSSDDSENTENTENNEDTPSDEKGPLKCVKCVDGAIEPVLPQKDKEFSICPQGSFDASVVPDPCNMEKDKKDDKKTEPEDVDIKATQKGRPGSPSPDPYHLPFMDDTNLGLALGAVHGTLYDFGLIGNEKKVKEEETKKEADKLENKAEDDGRVSCQKCEGGYPISNLFKDKCPEGWVESSDSNPCEEGTDPETDKKESTEDSTEESSFDKAFADARAQGLDEFTWNGKRYHTKTREEVDAENDQKTLDILEGGIQPPQSQSEIDIQNERNKILSGDDQWWNLDPNLQNQYNEIDSRSTTGARLGHEYSALHDFIKKATQGTETTDIEKWYQGYLHNIGQEEPMSFEQWKQDKLPFMDTSQVATPNVTPQDNSQVNLTVPQTNTAADFSVMGEDADGDGIPNSIDSDFAGTTPTVGPENQPPPAPTEILSCQFCDNGSPRSVPPVDGKCPEGTSPEDGTDPCAKEQDPNAQVEDKKEEGEDKSKRGPCPPTYEWDEEAKTCKPGRNFMRPFARVPKMLAKIKRNVQGKKDDMRRKSVTTKSDVVFADTIGEDYQGDTNINTGKKQGQNVYSRQGAYGTEVDKFIPTRGGKATIDMETYKKLIKAGAKLDIID